MGRGGRASCVVFVFALVGCGGGTGKVTSGRSDANSAPSSVLASTPATDTVVKQIPPPTTTSTSVVAQPTTTTPAQPPINIVDFNNAVLPIGSCEEVSWKAPDPIPMHNGHGSTGDPNNQPVVVGAETVYTYVEASIAGAASFADLDGNGTTDALVPLSCGAGGNWIEEMLIAVTIDPSGALALIGGHNRRGVAASVRGPGFSEITDAHLEGSTIVTQQSYAGSAEQDHFSYTGTVTVRSHWNGTSWVNEFARCSLDVMQADIGKSFFYAPMCYGDWAMGYLGDCGEQCESIDVFHFDQGHWKYLGGFYDLCAEALASSGIPLAVAQQIAPPGVMCQDKIHLVNEPPSGPLVTGMRGERVRALQLALIAAGHPDVVADGEYGVATSGAVIAVQVANGIPVDGIAGADTFAALGLPYT